MTKTTEATIRLMRLPRVSAPGRARKQANAQPAWKVMMMLLDRVLSSFVDRPARPNCSMKAGRARVPPRKALSYLGKWVAGRVRREDHVKHEL